VSSVDAVISAPCRFGRATFAHLATRRITRSG
jgi:hypothetical protein